MEDLSSAGGISAAEGRVSVLFSICTCVREVCIAIIDRIRISCGN